MLSINIPVFNVDVNDLILELVQQAEKLNVSYEINVYDDASKEIIKKVNQRVTQFSEVKYLEIEKNIGRAAIRNKMGFESRYKYLLFIDADSRIVKNNYLETFIKQASPDCVLCGGTAYQKEKPADPNKLLRWTYGTEREAISAEKRNNKKGFIITSNNFLVSKEIFQRINFREDIRDYGHEDTVFGFDLFKKEIEIRHIDNPVEHTGLEDADLFLQKSKTALNNLKYISEELLKNNDQFIGQVFFLNRFRSLTRWLPVGFLRLFYTGFHSILEKKLMGKNPDMLFFDIYKLGFYASIKNRDQN